MATRIAVVGMGARGTAWAREVRARPGFELVACADVDAGTLERAATELELAPGSRFARLDEALDATACDAVIVATSEDRHTEPCETALGRRLGVLVEKPFATSLVEAVSLVDLAERQGVPLIVGQQYRYLRSQRAARRVVREGGIGRVGMAVAHFYHGSDHLRPSHDAMPDKVLWGPVVHHLDALRYVLGEPITGLSAQTFSMPWGGPPEGASMQAILTMGEGIHATYTASYESSGHERFERGQEYYLRLVGETGTLHVLHRWLVLLRRGRPPRLVRRGPRRQTEEATLLDQLAAALGGGPPPEASGRDNLETVAALEACARSSREHRWIDPRELLAEAGG